MANIFTRSLGQLQDYLRDANGRIIETGEPAPTPYPARIIQPSTPNQPYVNPIYGRVLQVNEPEPTPYVRPAGPATVQPVRPASGTSGTVWNANAPSPLPPMQPTGNVTGAPTGAFVSVPQISPAAARVAQQQADQYRRGGAYSTGPEQGLNWAQVPPSRNVPNENVDVGYGPGVAAPRIDPSTGQPTVYPTIASDQGGPPAGPVLGGSSGASTGTTGVWNANAPAPAATNATANPSQPNKVTHTVESDTGKTVLTHQAKPPKPAGQTTSDGTTDQGDPDPDAPYLRAAAAAQGRGQRPQGPAPNVAPAQTPTQGQNVNLQVPAHPGLLQRIGQTIGHFFSGTLGQNQQQPTSGYRPGYGPGYTYGAPPTDQTGGSALSGVSRALSSGRQHVATHGGNAPASAPPPPPPSGAVAQDQGAPVQPESLVNPQNLAYASQTGEGTPLGDTNIVKGADGGLYRVDVTDPRRFTRIQ